MCNMSRRTRHLHQDTLGAQQVEKDQEKSMKALCQISPQHKLLSSPACAQAVPSSSDRSKAMLGESTWAHHLHQTPNKLQEWQMPTDMQEYCHLPKLRQGETQGVFAIK